MRFVVLLFSCLAFSTLVGASHTKYTYLMIGTGQSALVYAFKSKELCERAKRQHLTWWKKTMAPRLKEIRAMGGDVDDGNPRCKSSLPLGFQRPKTGH